MVSKEPFAPTVLRTVSAYYISPGSTSAIFQKGSKQTAHSFRFTSLLVVTSLALAPPSIAPNRYSVLYFS